MIITNSPPPTPKKKSASPLLPFRRKPESHSRDSENFPRSGTLQWSPVGECGFAAEIPAFAGMEGLVNAAAVLSFIPYFHSRESGNLFPRQREIPRSGSAMSPAAMRGGRCRPARFPLSREWKRGAGMKKGAGMEEGSGNLLNPPPTFSNRRGIAFLSGGLKCGRIRRRLCRRRGGRGGRSRWRPRRHGCRRECPPAM